MSDWEFPLCKRAGLVVERGATVTRVSFPVIEAIDVEQWLEKSPVVYGLTERGPNEWTCFSRTDGPSLGDTHTARLVMLEEIEHESAERKLLRELVTAWTNYSGTCPQLIERARKLLGEEK